MTSKDFLDEIKAQFSRHLSTRTNIDNKTYNMITISGTIATLLSAFLLIFERIFTSTFLHPVFFIITLFGIISMIISIVFALKSYTLRRQIQPITHDEFFENNGKGKYNDTVVKEFSELDSDIFISSFIEYYLDGIHSASDAIDYKSKWLVRSQKIFRIGIFSVLGIGVVYVIGYFVK